jgi:Flp pilus assembly protein TadG
LLSSNKAKDMTNHRRRRHPTSEKGVALVFMAVTLTMLLVFTGLTVDSGRGYVVKAQLTKAVDGAALGAARHLNSGNPRGEAEQLFLANFPSGYMGTSGTSPTASPSFFTLATDYSNGGRNIITVRASAQMPRTFMNLIRQGDVTVSAEGQATRRMLDLSLVLDVSSSLGGGWPAVRDATKAFIGAFDPANDRLALTTFGNGANVLDQMSASRGFNKAAVISHVATNLPGGSTNMVEGLYRGWDEIRTVAGGQQSSVRVIVLFTDGASNSVPGIYPAVPGVAMGLRTYDFPKNLPDPDSQTWDSPQIVGLFDTQTGSPTPNPPHSTTVPWNSTATLAQVPYLPLQSSHTHHRSGGIPTQFQLQSATLKVNGAAQNVRRPLRNWNANAGRYPAEVFNINNAARNLVEIIADRVRADGGDYPIRIYTIGMGLMVRQLIGTMPEKPEDILMRIANDTRSPDYNNTQLAGKYYYAATAADVGAAFQALQNEIIRLTK